LGIHGSLKFALPLREGPAPGHNPENLIISFLATITDPNPYTSDWEVHGHITDREDCTALPLAVKLK